MTSAVRELYYVKKMLIHTKWNSKNAKFGIEKVTENTNIEAPFHVHRCSTRQMFLNLLQISQENTYAEVSF